MANEKDRDHKAVAVIGCGRIAGHHCRAIQGVEGVDIVAVCDLDTTKAQPYGDEFGVPVYHNYHDMLKAQPEIDIVVIATPSGMHFEHACDVISRYQKHIIVEKPTFMTPEQVRDAYALGREHNCKIFPIFQNRFNKAVQQVKQALSGDALGQVRLVNVRVRWCRPQRYYDLSEWRGTFAMDGGALSNQGIHHVDLLRYLGGEVSEVQAIMQTYGAEIEVEDSVVATLKFASGAIGTLEVTTAARPDDFEASISIVAENGLAQIGGKAVNELEIFTPEPEQCPLNSEDFTGSVYGNGHQFLYQSIADHFLKGTEYLISEQDCYSSIQLLHSFYVSDEQQSRVCLQDNLSSSRMGKPDEALRALYHSPLDA